MFSAVGKYFRAVWYLMTFRVDKASETLRMNPGVISANYDRIIKEKKARLNQYKDAISAMVAQEETKKQKLKVVERRDRTTAEAEIRCRGESETDRPEARPRSDGHKERSGLPPLPELPSRISAPRLTEKQERAMELECGSGSLDQERVRTSNPDSIVDA